MLMLYVGGGVLNNVMKEGVHYSATELPHYYKEKNLVWETFELWKSLGRTCNLITGLYSSAKSGCMLTMFRASAKFYF